MLNDGVFIALGEGYEGKYLARGDEVLNELRDDERPNVFPAGPSFTHVSCNFSFLKNCVRGTL